MTILDISVELEAGMARYPSPYLPDVQLKSAASHEKEGRSVHIVTFGTHVSTHIDAPIHALPGGKTIDQIPPAHLFGPARILRFPNRDKTTPLNDTDFRSHKGLERCQKLVINSGWAARTARTQSYFTDGPFLTRAAASYLASLPALHLLGMDFPNIDAREDMVLGKPAPNHQIVLGRDIILLENLINLEKVDEKFLLSAAPPRLVGGDGCPCRALAIFPLSEFPDYLRD